MARKLERISIPIGKTLAARGLAGRLSEYRIFGQWEKTVGPGIASHAQPVSVRGRKLFLAVDSPAWMQQLSLLKPEIIGKVNRSLGKEAIKDITLRIGEIAPATRPPADASVRAVLDPEEREKIEEYVRHLHDAVNREAVRRVIEKDFLSRKGKQKK